MNIFYNYNIFIFIIIIIIIIFIYKYYTKNYEKFENTCYTDKIVSDYCNYICKFYTNKEKCFQNCPSFVNKKYILNPYNIFLNVFNNKRDKYFYNNNIKNINNLKNNKLLNTNKINKYYEYLTSNYKKKNILLGSKWILVNYNELDKNFNIENKINNTPEKKNIINKLKKSLSNNILIFDNNTEPSISEIKLLIPQNNDIHNKYKYWIKINDTTSNNFLYYKLFNYNCHDINDITHTNDFVKVNKFGNSWNIYFSYFKDDKPNGIVIPSYKINNDIEQLFYNKINNIVPYKWIELTNINDLNHLKLIENMNFIKLFKLFLSNKKPIINKTNKYYKFTHSEVIILYKYYNSYSINNYIKIDNKYYRPFSNIYFNDNELSNIYNLLNYNSYIKFYNNNEIIYFTIIPNVIKNTDFNNKCLEYGYINTPKIGKNDNEYIENNKENILHKINTDINKISINNLKTILNNNLDLNTENKILEYLKTNYNIDNNNYYNYDIVNEIIKEWDLFFKNKLIDDEKNLKNQLNSINSNCKYFNTDVDNWKNNYNIKINNIDYGYVKIPDSTEKNNEKYYIQNSEINSLQNDIDKKNGYCLYNSSDLNNITEINLNGTKYGKISNVNYNINNNENHYINNSEINNLKNIQNNINSNCKYNKENLINKTEIDIDGVKFGKIKNLNEENNENYYINNSKINELDNNINNINNNCLYSKENLINKTEIDIGGVKYGKIQDLNDNNYNNNYYINNSEIKSLKEQIEQSKNNCLINNNNIINNKIKVNNNEYGDTNFYILNSTAKKRIDNIKNSCYLSKETNLDDEININGTNYGIINDDKLIKFGTESNKYINTECPILKSDYNKYGLIGNTYGKYGKIKMNNNNGEYGEIGIKNGKYGRINTKGGNYGLINLDSNNNKEHIPLSKCIDSLNVEYNKLEELYKTNLDTNNKNITDLYDNTIVNYLDRLNKSDDLLCQYNEKKNNYFKCLNKYGNKDNTIMSFNKYKETDEFNDLENEINNIVPQIHSLKYRNKYTYGEGEGKYCKEVANNLNPDDYTEENSCLHINKDFKCLSNELNKSQKELDDKVNNYISNNKQNIIDLSFNKHISTYANKYKNGNKCNKQDNVPSNYVLENNSCNDSSHECRECEPECTPDKICINKDSYSNSELNDAYYIEKNERNKYWTGRHSNGEQCLPQNSVPKDFVLQDTTEACGDNKECVSKDLINKISKLTNNINNHDDTCIRLGLQTCKNEIKEKCIKNYYNGLCKFKKEYYKCDDKLFGECTDCDTTKCKSNEHLEGCGGLNKGECVKNKCVCPNGTPITNCSKNGEHKCIKCNKGFILKNNKCVNCPDNAICNSGFGQISKCKNNYLLKNNNGEKSCHNCPKYSKCNGYQNIIGCNDNGKYNEETEKCEKCPDNYKCNNGEIISGECSSNAYYNKNKDICEKCPKNGICDGSNNLKCNLNYFINGGKCQICPSNMSCDGKNIIIGNPNTNIFEGNSDIIP